MGCRSSSLLLTILLLSVLFSLSFPQGYGRRVKVMRWHSSEHSSHKGNSLPERKTMAMLMDYEGPKANTNPNNGGGAILLPPPSPPAPPPIMH